MAALLLLDGTLAGTVPIDATTITGIKLRLGFVSADGMTTQTVRYDNVTVDAAL